MSKLYVTTTCREAPAAVRRFVTANLAAGADHVYVFLDEPDDEIACYLTGHPNATGIVTDDHYWREGRPVGVNTRQKINANVIRTLLAPCAWAGWLFHLDADETLHLDRSVLDRMPDEVRAVRLAPLEVVCAEEPGWEGWYKRLLNADELALLGLLDLIEAPSNQAYFHGHQVGKVGIRPTLELALEIHFATVEHEPQPLEKHPRLAHLHDDATTFEEFVRKWTRNAQPSANAHFKDSRKLLRNAIRAVLAAPVDETVRRELLHELYRRSSVDPVDQLHRLGLLVRVDDLEPDHTPDGHSAEQQALLDVLLEALLAQGTDVFRPGRPLRQQARALARAGEVLREQHPAFADRITALTRPVLAAPMQTGQQSSQQSAHAAGSAGGASWSGLAGKLRDRLPMAAASRIVGRLRRPAR